ncbi:MAG: hypothetical protein AAF182_04020 [Pseudomonadota bacterium]
MDSISKTLGYSFVSATFSRRSTLDFSYKNTTNPYRMHDRGYYNQRISLNIMSKAVQLYNDVVAARDVHKSITQLKALISTGESIKLGNSSLNDLLQDRIDVSIREINAIKAKLNIDA